MKNQYFGDENDYKKYSVIKIICADEIKPFFEWLLTKNDKKNDGNLTSYLKNPETLLKPRFNKRFNKRDSNFLIKNNEKLF